MILGHLFFLSTLLCQARKLEHHHWYLYSFREKVFEAAKGPAQGYFLFIESPCIFVLDQYFNHSGSFLIFSSFDFLFDKDLNLFLFYIKQQLL